MLPLAHCGGRGGTDAVAAPQIEHQEKIITSLRGELRIARSGRPGSGRHGGGGVPRPRRPTSAELRKTAAADLDREYAAANMKLLQVWEAKGCLYACRSAHANPAFMSLSSPPPQLENTKQLELSNLLKDKLAKSEALVGKPHRGTNNSTEFRIC